MVFMNLRACTTTGGRDGQTFAYRRGARGRIRDAGVCVPLPLDGKAIDAGLVASSLPADVKSEIEALRDKGLGQHNDGDHETAQTTLAEAMRLLLNNL